MQGLSRQSKAYLLGVLAVLCWSTVATAFKLSLQWLTPAQLLLYAGLVSSLVLGLLLLAQGKLAQAFRLDRQTLRSSVLFGALNPFAYYLILFKAYTLLSAQEAQAINYTWALTMTLLAVPLLKQHLRLQDMLAALLCYLGVLVIATQGNVSGLQFSSLPGVGFALLSTVVWALYWILNTRDTRDPVTGLFLNFLFSLPLILLWCWWQGELTPVDWRGLLGAGYVGVFEMGLTFVLWLGAMKHTDSTARIANLIFISPFLSLLFISSFLGESILPSTLYGLLLIIAGLLIQQLRARKTTTPS